MFGTLRHILALKDNLFGVDTVISIAVAQGGVPAMTEHHWLGTQNSRQETCLFVPHEYRSKPPVVSRLFGIVSSTVVL